MIPLPNQPPKSAPVLGKEGLFTYLWSRWFVQVQQIINSGPVLEKSTVANLPNGQFGMYAIVTDANAPTYNAIVAGGGAITIPVFYDGTHWRCH